MFDQIIKSTSQYWNYLCNQVLFPSWHNYFYWLLALSLGIWLLELVFPWRKSQKPFRKDFWLDGFYMFFNYFLLGLIGFAAISTICVDLFNNFLGLFGFKNIVAIHLQSLPFWSKLLIMFVLRDFIQWNVHRLLHRTPWMWEFHKVHHSVQEMGFAAHLRFHWMETVFYRTIEYIPLAMIGFGLTDFFIVHIFATAIGHLNHANLKITYGPLKYIFNNPVMHLHHHALEVPDGKTGVNFGLSLSCWDYIFGTAHIPNENGKTKLGFKKLELFPKGFFGQFFHFRKVK